MFINLKKMGDYIYTRKMVFVKWLDETGIDELDLVGGKNASLGEMIQNLKTLGIHVPFGFVVTSRAFDFYMEHNDLDNKITS